MMHDDDGNVYDWTTRMYTIGLGVMLKGLLCTCLHTNIIFCRFYKVLSFQNFCKPPTTLCYLFVHHDDEKICHPQAEENNFG